MTAKTIFILLVLFTFLSGCEDDDFKFQKRDYAVLQSELKEISENGALLKGNILTSGDSEIKELGFVLGNSMDNFPRKIVLDEVGDEFEVLVNSQIEAGMTIYFKAYSEGEQYTSYGNVVSFVSLGFILDDPEIHSFYPQDVIEGTLVTLAGLNFGNDPEKISVSTENTNCPIIESSSDTIIFEIPKLSIGPKTFTLKVYDKELAFGPILIHGPEILDFRPGEGYDGVQVKIMGAYFGKDPRVFFGEDEANIQWKTDSVIMVLSPLTANSGEVVISVQVNDRSGVSEKAYEILSHSISNVSSTEVRVGDTITIYGEGFVQGMRKSTVWFTLGSAEILNSSPNELEVIVPWPLHEGPYHKLTVSNGLKSFVYGSDILYLDLEEE